MGIILTKPVLVGLHLAFAIVGIDAFIWIIGELIAKEYSSFRIRLASLIGVVAFALSWLFGGYYYVVYYGTIVKPIIKAGTAPWAHAIVMEAKEHIFLFILPLALTAMFFTFLKRETVEAMGLKKSGFLLVALIVVVALTIGAMGYIISAAARWG